MAEYWLWLSTLEEVLCIQTFRFHTSTSPPIQNIPHQIPCSKSCGKKETCLHKNYPVSQARWLTPIIPALWEPEVGGSRGQEIETILVNKVKPRSTKNTKISWAWWCMPVMPATQEAEAGELLEPRRQRLR